MASISKRSQARNEKALQELIKTVPGNDKCADCGARNPGWASWSLGIFLCMRCASLHRKLGTHISKVKSLSMDSWTNEQVDNMKRNGNTKVNRTYNPQNSKPSIPLDVDEVDSVLERFIRQKYDQQSFSSNSSRPVMRQDTGSTKSSDDAPPPPLPSKPARRFGFGLRSASSAIPLHFSNHTSPPQSPPSSHGWANEPLRVNKQSRVFGASVGGSNDNMETKMNQLRDMGFGDEKRCASVLKGFGGNLEKTIEQLVRLGEGSTPASRSRTPIPVKNAATNQDPSVGNSEGLKGNGISFETKDTVSPTNPSPPSQPAVPSPTHAAQQSAPQSLRPANGYGSPAFGTNTNYTSTAQFSPIDQAFSNMQISQQPQPQLFPNATGGYPNSPPHVQDVRLQTMTPPLQQGQFQQTNPYLAQYQTQAQFPVNHTNPFLQQMQQSAISPSNPYNPAYQQQSPVSHNPFFQSHAAASPQFSQGSGSPTAMSPQQGIGQQASMQPFPDQHWNNPAQQHVSSPMPPAGSAPAPNQPQVWNPFQHQTILPQQTSRLDKSSILALYSYPQLAPPPTVEEEQRADDPPNANNTVKQAPQRSVTMPVAPTTGNRNPFQTSANSQQNNRPNPPSIGRHISQESVDIGGFQNGRHSPDAFANLSARYVR